MATLSYPASYDATAVSIKLIRQSGAASIFVISCGGQQRVNTAALPRHDKHYTRGPGTAPVCAARSRVEPSGFCCAGAPTLDGEPVQVYSSVSSNDEAMAVAVGASPHYPQQWLRSSQSNMYDCFLDAKLSFPAACGLWSLS